MNDRIGDFMQTGAGPMADFFENIAPKVGVNAEQFAKLSGPEALQLYVSSLEKANVNQQEMTFYLEAMASDVTMLLPLLRNGGKGFRELAEDAEKLGWVLGDDQVSAITDMNRAFGKVQATIQGIIAHVTAELAPSITRIANEFLGFVKGFDGGAGVAGIADQIARGLLSGNHH